MSPSPASLHRFWILLALVTAAALPAMAPAQPIAQSVGGGRFRVEFVCEAPPGTGSVHLAGSFNDWSMTAAPMAGPDADGRFTLALDLGGGRYEYKFVLDGSRWISDERNPNRLPPHDNAVLHLGEGPAAPAVEAALTPADMVPFAPHPRAIATLGRAEVSDDWHYESQLTKAGLAGQMPWFADGTMSFVVRADDASDVRLHLSAPSFDHHYPMARLTPGGSVYAVTLRSDPRLLGATYEIEIAAADGVRSQLDAQARMQTSRAGRPVSVIAPADPARGRIVHLGRIADVTRSVAARDVYVYLPPGYAVEPEHRYPVVYLHDGQNCWDDPSEPFGHGGWQVNVTADRLIAAGEVEPFIAVGVANTPDRITEYGPGPDILAATAHPYLDYLVRDVKPMIDARFRTRPGRESTFVMGSSLGGVISFQLALRRPDVFGGAACLSSAFWFKDSHGKGYFDLLAQTGRQPVRLYIDSGTAGTNEDGAADTRRMADALRHAGWTDADLMHHEAEGAAHNEQAWRARVDKPLRFLMETSRSPKVQKSK